MEELITGHRVQLIGTAIALAAFAGLRTILRWLVHNAVIKLDHKAREEREVMRLIRLLLLLMVAAVLTAIRRLKQHEILLFAASAITVLGVAFFAGMSILSNITAFLVLFFQHPVGLGDTLRLRDQEQDIEGELVDITYFFVFIRPRDGRTVTVPNSVLLKSPFAIASSHPN
ncbi:MAG TPA: mechanosensitive ion channel [Flavobacteriales bacterium]|nr:mechanosensitive ion channel [Flavobacteriales bacterium]HMR26382.1 mechanosensitive ion channel [Flavobacteriales bacterium]